jgi:hypothetical protein
VGDFVGAIGQGVGGLVGGSIDALGIAAGTIWGQLNAWLPGPLLPIVLIVVGALFLRWVFAK